MNLKELKRLENEQHEDRKRARNNELGGQNKIALEEGIRARRNTIRSLWQREKKVLGLPLTRTDVVS